ncbi:MAG: SDR family NAD(P)-dependent oxidoreductase [Aggregatilineales bacterium]
MKRAAAWLIGGAAGIAGSYWLLRYLRPRHSALAFDGAVAVIADATSPIGQAIALALARRGARLVLVGPDANTLDTLRQAVDPYAADVLTLLADPFNESGREALVETVLAHYKRIDLFIVELNGMAGGPFDLLDDAEITAAAAWLSGALALTRWVLSPMRTRGAGLIVYLTPIAGRVAMPGLGLTGAAAHGLVGFADALRREVFGTGVQIVTALTGWTRDAGTHTAVQRLAQRAHLPLLDPPEIAEALLNGLLNGQAEIVIGGRPYRALVELERYAPFLATLYWRALNSPMWLAAARASAPDANAKGTPA